MRRERGQLRAVRRRVALNTWARSQSATFPCSESAPSPPPAPIPAPTPGCVDLDQNCDYYRSLSYCSGSSTYYGFMQNNFCATCGFGPSPPTPSPGCADLDANCQYYKSQSYCASSSMYHGFKQNNCCATCGFGLPHSLDVQV